jgi:hypothetical protein
VAYLAELIRTASAVRPIENDLGSCIQVDRTNDPIAELLYLDLGTGLVIRRESIQYPQECRGERLPFMAVRRTFRDISFVAIPEDVFEFGAEDDRKAGKEVRTEYTEASSGD